MVKNDCINYCISATFCKAYITRFFEKNIWFFTYKQAVEQQQILRTSCNCGQFYLRLWLIAPMQRYTRYLMRRKETFKKENTSFWRELRHFNSLRPRDAYMRDLTIIGSDNGLSPGRRQAIIWTNAELLLNRTFGTNFSEILIEILTSQFKKMHLKVSSAKWRPFCLDHSVLMRL